MSFLKEVKTGKVDSNIFALILGPSGVGKSSFCADAPSPIFLPTEDGTNNLDVARLPRPKTFGESLKMIDELQNTEHEFKTVVIDSIDWLQALCWAEVCLENSVKSILDIPYGKGYALADMKWKDFLNKLKTLRLKMNILLIAHSEVASFSDPVTASSYDRHQIKLHKNASALFKEAVDFVGFANYQTFVKKDGMKNRAFGDGARALFTEHRPAHDGKNRYGLPYELPLSWEEFIKAVKLGQPDALETVQRDICALLEMVKDDELKKVVTKSVTEAGKNTNQLIKIRERLRIKMEV